ncbi:MAG: methyl-accepting chemotaxis protein [Bacteroidetes bacterium]|nr:methyl-accepting chemotaxis protein [Bacteroidota bacterium]
MNTLLRKANRTVDIENAIGEVESSHGEMYKYITWGRAKYSEQRMTELSREIFTKIEKAKKSFEQLSATAITSQQRAQEFQHIADAINEYLKTAQSVIELASFDLNTATMQLGILDEKFQRVHSLVAELQDKRKQENEADVQRAETAQEQATTLFWIVLAGVIALSIFIVIKINRLILTTIFQLRDSFQRVANGDVTVSVPVHTNDELGAMAESFNAMTKELRELLQKVSESTETIASATTEISSSTEQMSAGAQEQSSQASEVASAVEEMTKTIVENSKNASLTAETARKARDTAKEGSIIVRDTIDGMKQIASVVNRSAETVQALGKASDQIGEIISVIDDIADQTNLLALNAAIEAARAGEQGRGFAVVADEVRKLAERTTKATKEIATMIRHIQNETKGAVISMEEGTQKVEYGISLADKAGKALENIVEISQQVTDMVNQIAAASEQQSSASEQISKNIEAISTVTQQTASGIQQIAHSAENLNQLTEQLRDLVSRFKLETEQVKQRMREQHQTKSRPIREYHRI